MNRDEGSFLDACVCVNQYDDDIMMMRMMIEMHWFGEITFICSVHTVIWMKRVSIVLAIGCARYSCSYLRQNGGNETFDQKLWTHFWDSRFTYWTSAMCWMWIWLVAFDATNLSLNFRLCFAFWLRPVPSGRCHNWAPVYRPSDSLASFWMHRLHFCRRNRNPNRLNTGIRVVRVVGQMKETVMIWMAWFHTCRLEW